jgi:hypothetical protein
MDEFDSRLRDQLFVVRLTRHLAHERAIRESEVTHRLHEEIHQVMDRARRLRRLGRWLRLTKRPLPRQVAR